MKARTAAIAIAAALFVSDRSAVIARGATTTGIQVINPDLTAGSFGANVESLHGLNINGVTTLFYSAKPSRIADYALYESQLINGGWVSQPIFSTTPHVSYIGATVANGVTYVAVDTAGGPMSILSNSGGSWNVEYQESSPQGDAHVGEFVAMTTVNNSPAAVYAGAYPPSGAYSPNAKTAQKVNGVWQSSAIPMPQNAGILGFSPMQVGSDLAFLATTYGGSGDFYLQRSGGFGGTWASQSAYSGPDTAGKIALVNGKVAFAGSDDWNYYDQQGGTPSYVTMQGGTFVAQPMPPSNSLIVGDDFAVVNGVPTFAGFNRNDNRLHYMEMHNGAFVDSTLTSGAADGRDAVIVFQAADGNTAVAFLQDLSNGAVSLSYTEVPEPGVAAGCALLGAVMLSRRRRWRAA